MNAWIAGARPRTLPAAVVPVLVGTAAAAGMDGDIGALKGLIVWRFLAALVVSLALQIGMNYANDYSDGMRGTDDARVGPLRLVGLGPGRPGAVKRAALAVVRRRRGGRRGAGATRRWWLIVVGLAPIAAGWFYTGGPRPYGYAGFGEVFVFVFFGLVATVGSTYVQIEHGHLAVGRWRRCPSGSLAIALLVVNNLRDIPGDTVSGKRTLAVRLGDQRTRILYIVLMVLPFVVRAGRRRAVGPTARRRLACSSWCSSNKPRAERAAGRQGPRPHPRARGRPAGSSCCSASLLAAGLFVGG